MATTAELLSEGDKAPAFDLPRDGGGRIASKDLEGKPFVIYLYPKDDTSGCTTEAIAFTEAYDEFKALGVEIVGLSKDDVASHDKFVKKHSLGIPLAADVDGGLVEGLGAWVQKSMYGKKYMGIDRSTFLIAADGTIAKVWRKVKVPGHVDEVLAAAKQLAAK